MVETKNGAKREWLLHQETRCMTEYVIMFSNVKKQDILHFFFVIWHIF